VQVFGNGTTYATDLMPSAVFSELLTFTVSEFFSLPDLPTRSSATEDQDVTELPFFLLRGSTENDLTSDFT